MQTNLLKRTSFRDKRAHIICSIRTLTKATPSLIGTKSAGLNKNFALLQPSSGNLSWLNKFAQNRSDYSTIYYIFGDNFVFLWMLASASKNFSSCIIKSDVWESLDHDLCFCSSSCAPCTIEKAWKAPR